MKRVEGIRAVTYDCWGTLLKDRDWKGAMARRVDALRHFVDLDQESARRLLNEAWNKHDEAWKQVETFGPGRMAAYCLEAQGIDDDEAIAQLTQRFEEMVLETGVDRVAGSLETVESLRVAGIRLALICDTGVTPGRVVRRLLDEHELSQHFEALCFSDEVGVPKPGNEIFAKALSELGVAPRDAIHVGDLKRTDIAGARDIGMQAARYRGVHDDLSDASDADIVLDRHEELLAVIGLA